MLSTIALLAVLAAEPPAPDFKVEAIEVLRFDNRTGELEPLGETGFNTYGDLLVKVKVTSPTSAYPKGRQLTIELTDEAKARTEKRDIRGVGPDNTTYVLAFFQTNIVCSPITVRVKLTGQKTASTKELKLTRFDCGE